MTTKEVRAALKAELGYNSRQVSVKERSYYATYLTIRTAEVQAHKVKDFAATLSAQSDNTYRVVYSPDAQKEFGANFMEGLAEALQALPQDGRRGDRFKGFLFFREGTSIDLRGINRDGDTEMIGNFYITSLEDIAFSMGVYEQEIQSEKCFQRIEVGAKLYQKSYNDSTKYTECKVVAANNENNRQSYTIEEEGKTREIDQDYLCSGWMTKEKMNEEVKEAQERKEARKTYERNHAAFMQKMDLVFLGGGSYFESAKWAGLNKNETLKEYKEEVNSGDYTTEKSNVIAHIELDGMYFDFFANNLMSDYGLKECGGHESDAKIKSTGEIWEWSEADKELFKRTCYRNTVKVINTNTGQSFLVDSQGYDYARYVGI